MDLFILNSLSSLQPYQRLPHANYHPNLGGSADLGVYIAVVVVTVMVLLGIVVSICYCIKINTRKETSPARRCTVVALNPYRMADFGLTALVKQDELRVDGSLEKGFESSNFRLVKDALTKRLDAFGGQMPQRYIIDSIKGLIEHHTGTSQHHQFEMLMSQTEMVMIQKNEHGAAVMAEMIWSSALTIQGTELCSILNAAIRQDHPENIVYAGNAKPTSFC